jgi:hypothetical protein
MGNRSWPQLSQVRLFQVATPMKLDHGALRTRRSSVASDSQQHSKMGPHSDLDWLLRVQLQHIDLALCGAS